MKDWLVDSFMDLCRPFHDNGLPPDLQAEDIESYGFVRGAMHRAARLSHSMNIEFGVFQIIGQKFARRAAKAWRPFERLLMEDISVAWTIVELRPSGNGVLQTDLERLKLLLERYVSFYGSLEDQRGFPEGFERFLCTRRNTD